jgi:hypothetical protein
MADHAALDRPRGDDDPLERAIESDDASADDRTSVDVRGTITLSDEAALPSLAEALRRGGCLVEPAPPSSLEFAFRWDGSGVDRSLPHAWSEIVFFLHAWQERQGDITIDVEDVRFAPSERAAAGAA